MWPQGRHTPVTRTLHSPQGIPQGFGQVCVHCLKEWSQGS